MKVQQSNQLINPFRGIRFVIKQIISVYSLLLLRDTIHADSNLPFFKQDHSFEYRFHKS